MSFDQLGIDIRFAAGGKKTAGGLALRLQNGPENAAAPSARSGRSRPARRCG